MPDETDRIDIIEYQGRWVMRVKGPYGRKDKGKSVWCAKIDGPDPKFGLHRTFIGVKQDVTVEYGCSQYHEVHVIVPLDELQDGDLLQISTGKFQRKFYRWKEFYKKVLPQLSNHGHNACHIDWFMESLDESRFKQLFGLKLSGVRLAAEQNRAPVRKFRMSEAE